MNDILFSYIISLRDYTIVFMEIIKQQAKNTAIYTEENIIIVSFIHVNRNLRRNKIEFYQM